MPMAPPNGFGPGAQWNYYWGGDNSNPYFQPGVAYWPGATLGSAPQGSYDPNTWQTFNGANPSATWGNTVPASSLGGNPFTATGGGGNPQPAGMGLPIDSGGRSANLLGPTSPGFPSSYNPGSPSDGGASGLLPPGMGMDFGMPSVPGFGGNSILGGSDLGSILSSIPGLGGGGVPGFGNSAFGGPGGILGKIFGGTTPNLNSILQSIIPIAASLTSYLGSDKAFNQAGNLINAAELGAAGGVRGATGNANDLLNSLMGTTTANAAPYIGAGAGAAGQLASGLQPGGALNSTLTADQLLKNDPGYQFRLGQGEGDLQSRLAAEGLTGSGEAQKQLSDYQQNFASSEFQNAFERQQQQQQALFSRLAGTAGLGLQGGGQALTSAEAFGAPQASNTIASSVYGGNAGVTGAGAQAGALIDVNQQKSALVQNIMTALLGLLKPVSQQQPRYI